MRVPDRAALAHLSHYWKKESETALLPDVFCQSSETNRVSLSALLSVAHERTKLSSKVEATGRWKQTNEQLTFRLPFSIGTIIIIVWTISQCYREHSVTQKQLHPRKLLKSQWIIFTYFILNRHCTLHFLQHSQNEYWKCEFRSNEDLPGSSAARIILNNPVKAGKYPRQISCKDFRWHSRLWHAFGVYGYINYILRKLSVTAYNKTVLLCMIMNQRMKVMGKVTHKVTMTWNKRTQQPRQKCCQKFIANHSMTLSRLL